MVVAKTDKLRWKSFWHSTNIIEAIITRSAVLIVFLISFSVRLPTGSDSSKYFLRLDHRGRLVLTDFQRVHRRQFPDTYVAGLNLHALTMNTICTKITFKLSFPKLGWKCLLIEFSVYIDGKNTKHQYTVDALISLNLHTLIVIQHNLRNHKIYWNLKRSENV